MDVLYVGRAGAGGDVGLGKGWLDKSRQQVRFDARVCRWVSILAFMASLYKPPLVSQFFLIRI